MRTLIALALILSPALASADAITDKIEVATAQTFVVEDPFGHQRKVTCGRYVVRNATGDRIGLRQFVFSGGTLYLEGDKGFATEWERGCR